MSQNNNGFQLFPDDENENEGGLTTQLFGKQISTASAGSKRLRLSPDDDHSPKLKLGSHVDGGSSSSGINVKPPKLQKRTRPFLHLLEESLSKGKEKQEPNPTSDREKLKATNFPAIHIKIGSWERISMHEADLTVKVYYAKQRLVWEVLDGTMKSKMEVPWNDIIAIRAVTNENQPGTLEVELERPPLFFREMCPQPKRHSLWEQTSDFTGGHAAIWRRHIVRFPPGVLDKHYKKLLEFDPWLKALSKKPYPTKLSPYFDPIMVRPSLDFELRHPHYTPIRTPPLSLTPNPSLSAFDAPYYQFGTHQRMNAPSYNYGYQSQPIPNAAGSSMDPNLWNRPQFAYNGQGTFLGNIGSTYPFNNNNMNYHPGMAYHVPQGQQVMHNMAMPMSSNYGLHARMASDTGNRVAVTTQDMTNSYPPVSRTSASIGTGLSLKFNDETI